MTFAQSMVCWLKQLPDDILNIANYFFLFSLLLFIFIFLGFVSYVC